MTSCGFTPLSDYVDASWTRDGRLIISDEVSTVILNETAVLELEKFLRDRPAPF